MLYFPELTKEELDYDLQIYMKIAAGLALEVVKLRNTDEYASDILFEYYEKVKTEMEDK